MLDHNTISKLREMRMGVMASAIQDQLGNNAFQEISFEERVGLMVDTKWTTRKNDRLARLIRNAAFSIPGVCPKDIEYHPDGELDKMLIMRLGTCNYVDEHHDIIIMGPPAAEKLISPMLSGSLPLVSCIQFATLGCRICLASWLLPELKEPITR